MTTRREIRKRLNKVMRDLEEIEREVVVFMDGPAVEIVGTKEAADVLGITPNAISLRVSRGTFVEPLAVLSCGPIWRLDDIEALA